MMPMAPVMFWSLMTKHDCKPAITTNQDLTSRLVNVLCHGHLTFSMPPLSSSDSTTTLASQWVFSDVVSADYIPCLWWFVLGEPMIICARAWFSLNLSEKVSDRVRFDIACSRPLTNPQLCPPPPSPAHPHGVHRGPPVSSVTSCFPSEWHWYLKTKIWLTACC